LNDDYDNDAEKGPLGGADFDTERGEAEENISPAGCVIRYFL
jgi:hypothetical protein